MSRRGIKTTSTACTETDRGPEQVQRLMRAIGKFEKKWDLVSQLFFPVDLQCAKVIGADQSVKEFSVNKDQTKLILLPQISL